MSGRRESLAVLSIDQCAPAIGDQQRAGLQHIAAQITGQLVTPGDPRKSVNDMHARAETPQGSSNAIDGRGSPPPGPARAVGNPVA